MPISLSTAIYEWMPCDDYHNFGDHLMLLIGERLFKKQSWDSLLADQSHKYVFLGSCIHDFTLRNITQGGGWNPVLIGCGCRGETTSDTFLKKTAFFGCRGFLTQEVLSQHGLNVKVIGDPAMVLPLIVPNYWRQSSHKTLFIPHINDAQRNCYTAHEMGCDLLLQPETRNIDNLINLIQVISQAKFVLAGAMHAAIVAHAYGVPFAFFRKENGYLDCPFKWDDWLTSISIPIVKSQFFDNASSGMHWYKANQPYFNKNQFTPILKAYANIGQINHWIMLKAAFFDYFNF